ncbi:MAG TPA: DUF2703 domain-containing protein [Tissierellaceae bacterium]|nr:DUF2703 domain-containing protein [Tissierellaceae bacterium]
MKTLIIEWRHLDVKGETCDRCSQTGANLVDEINLLNRKLKSLEIQVMLKENKLDEVRVNESNMILINNVPLENIIDIRVVDNFCKSCSDLVGSETYCRAVYYKGKKFDDVPRIAIREAVAKSLGLRIRKKKG